MITDARVLKPEFIPREVQYRDSEVNHLTSTLSPITRGEAAEPAVLFGPSGTGKTCIAKFAVERLRQETIDVNTQYVNCWRDYTEFRALHRLLDGIDRTVDVHRQSTPKDEMLHRLQAYDGPPYVVILDEVDQLEDERVLYNLYRTPTVSTVLIANDETTFFNGLDERIASRLQGASRIRFDRYDIDALVAILRARVEWGLQPDAVSTDQLELIADEAAGDAREAIGILRNAARRADDRDADAITDDDLAAATAQTRERLRQKDLEKLHPHQREVYEIVVGAAELPPGEIYDRYRDRVEDPRSKRQVRKYLSKLCQYNLMDATGEGPSRRYSARPIE